MENVAFSLDSSSRPSGYKIPNGKKLEFYRGDKIQKNYADNICISRGVLNSSTHSNAFIKRIHTLLSSQSTPCGDEYKTLEEFFPTKTCDIGYLARKITGRYKNWCDVLIDFHTDKTPFDPFVSVSRCHRQAGEFAQLDDEYVIKLAVKGCRVLPDRFNLGKSFGSEFFILGAIKSNEIITH